MCVIRDIPLSSATVEASETKEEQMKSAFCKQISTAELIAARIEGIMDPCGWMREEQENLRHNKS